MEKRLIKSGVIWLNDIQYEIRFFQTKKATDQINYFLEVDFDNRDKIIMDDDNFDRLEENAYIVLPVAYQSRIVAKMDTKCTDIK